MLELGLKGRIKSEDVDLNMDQIIKDVAAMLRMVNCDPKVLRSHEVFLKRKVT